MDSPAGGRQRRSDSTPRASILGSVTVAGEPEQVSLVRKFIVRTLDVAGLPGIDSDAATLLTSELVTNALLHTDSGRPGGSVTVVIRGLPEGILVEVVDEGSAGTPVVKDDALAGEGQGLYLVQQMAAQWGYLRDNAGTTVWFYLPAPPPGGGPPGMRRGGDQHRAASKARAAASTPSQISARSSSLVT
jgi:anti-sigma regulatory factor (Ser/Thr protein kinase)